jgi:hypothetical protein
MNIQAYRQAGATEKKKESFERVWRYSDLAGEAACKLDALAPRFGLNLHPLGHHLKIVPRGPERCSPIAESRLVGPSQRLALLLS